MTNGIKLLAVLPLMALVAGCVEADGGIDGRQDLERTIDTDLDADGTITEFGGIESPPE
jgi:hypothetical protein